MDNVREGKTTYFDKDGNEMTKEEHEKKQGIVPEEAKDDTETSADSD